MSVVDFPTKSKRMEKREFPPLLLPTGAWDKVGQTIKPGGEWNSYPAPGWHSVAGPALEAANGGRARFGRPFPINKILDEPVHQHAYQAAGCHPETIDHPQFLWLVANGGKRKRFYPAAIISHSYERFDWGDVDTGGMQCRTLPVTSWYYPDRCRVDLIAAPWITLYDLRLQSRAK